MIRHLASFPADEAAQWSIRMLQRGMKTAGRKRRVVLTSLLALALAYALGLIWFVAGLERNSSEAKSADAIVALTGGDARLSKAMELLSNGRGKRLLISGVHGDVTRDQLYAQIGGQRELFDCCVDLGLSADSTIGNAQEAASWARDNGYKSVILVTAAYHMPRSKMELAAAMPDIQLISQPVFPEDLKTKNWWSDRLSATVIVVEYTKLLFAWTRLAAADTIGLTSHPEVNAKIDYGQARPGREPQALWEAAKSRGS
jgi:uncharacterized SAM-binding protein YcdF (DUF218 family)